MRAPYALLARPAERGARWLALGYLDDARAAHARLGDPGDGEALHDFRVALRRLRSLMRAYREPLAGSVGKRDRRRVGELSHATGDARDLEVQAAWVEGVRREAAEDEAPGVDHVLSLLLERSEGARQVLHREAARRFPRQRKRLARRLGRYRETVSLDAPGEGTPLSATLALLLAAAEEELRARLAAAGEIEDQAEAHQARIAAKRLRYLVEPWEEAVPGVRGVVKTLKALQDVLGEMHDAVVLRGEVAEAVAGASAEGAAALLPGLRALEGRLDGRRDRAWEAFAAVWKGEEGERFFGRLRRVREALATRGRPRDVEVERKYLLRSFPRLPDGAEVQEIDQGWLPGERLQERVRRVRGPGGEHWYRTVKVGSGVTRVELEEETPRDVARRLWGLTKGRRVRKRRYTVRDGALAWEIDRFRGRRLALAEVELPSEDHPVEIPPWLRPFVVREVTGEPEYLNINLAR